MSRKKCRQDQSRDRTFRNERCYWIEWVELLVLIPQLTGKFPLSIRASQLSTSPEKLKLFLSDITHIVSGVRLVLTAVRNTVVSKR